MRCKSCNVALSAREAGRKDKYDGSFMDLCNECYGISEAVVADVYMDYPDYDQWEVTENIIPKG